MKYLYICKGKKRLMKALLSNIILVVVVVLVVARSWVENGIA